MLGADGWEVEMGGVRRAVVLGVAAVAAGWGGGGVGGARGGPPGGGGGGGWGGARGGAPGAAPVKKFALSAGELKRLTSLPGYCYASDRIVVDGSRVGYMYREQPERDGDSGWRFLAGDEDEAYMDNPANLGLYEVNTIANYSPDIVPFLDVSGPAAFIRDPKTGVLGPDPLGPPEAR